jgi:hypothetical protein
MAADSGVPVDLAKLVSTDRPQDYLRDKLKVIECRKFLIRSQQRLFSA